MNSIVTIFNTYLHVGNKIIQKYAFIGLLFHLFHCLEIGSEKYELGRYISGLILRLKKHIIIILLCEINFLISFSVQDLIIHR